MQHEGMAQPKLTAPAAAAGIHLLAVALLPIWAGILLAGGDGALALHLWTARIALLACTLLVVSLTTAWRLSLAAPQLVMRAALLLAAELVQYALGERGAVAVHVPLGLVILVGAVMIAREVIAGRAGRVGPAG